MSRALFGVESDLKNLSDLDLQVAMRANVPGAETEFSLRAWCRQRRLGMRRPEISLGLSGSSSETNARPLPDPRDKQAQQSDAPKPSPKGTDP